MTPSTPDAYVSRGGDKLAAALDHFELEVAGRVCADLGSQTGGFVDCLLRRGASRVYSVDTCYGTLAWKLRRDSRVVVFERTNAMHVTLPEPVDVVTIDVGWTPQARILRNAANLARASPRGYVVTLIKPHYEFPRYAASAVRTEREAGAKGPATPLVDGVLPDDQADKVVDAVLREITGMGWTVLGTTQSPIRGHAGNREVFALLALA